MCLSLLWPKSSVLITYTPIDLTIEPTQVFEGYTMLNPKSKPENRVGPGHDFLLDLPKVSLCEGVEPAQQILGSRWGKPVKG